MNISTLNRFRYVVVIYTANGFITSFTLTSFLFIFCLLYRILNPSNTDTFLQRSKYVSEKGATNVRMGRGNTFRGIFVNRLLERRYNVPETFWKGCANAPQTVSPNIFTTFQKRYRNRVCERSDGQGVTRFETVLEAFLQNVSKMF